MKGGRRSVVEGIKFPSEAFSEEQLLYVPLKRRLHKHHEVLPFGGISKKITVTYEGGTLSLPDRTKTLFSQGRGGKGPKKEG